MSNKRDDRPLAPPANLGKADNEKTQPVRRPATSAGNSAPTQQRPGDATTQFHRPVPAQAQPAAPVGTTTTDQPPAQRSDADAKAEKQREKERKAALAAEEKQRKKAEREERKANSRKPKKTRRARLRLTRLDPWSVTKVAFLLSIAFGIMCVVAVFLVASILTAADVWGTINTAVQDVLNQRQGEEFDITEYVGMSRVMGITMLIAAVNVVLLTALATLGAFLYNMAAALLGGIEVTLAEDLK